MNEHHCYVHIFEHEILVMAECSINLIHHILLNNTSVLVSRPMFTGWLIREAMEISLHHVCKMNRVPPWQILETPHVLPEEEIL
jgi:hypothetical protein